jgi:hypothetical protein
MATLIYRDMSLYWLVFLFYIDIQLFVARTTLHHSPQVHSSDNDYRVNDRYHSLERCRTFDDLGDIPWLKTTSTFYNLGVLRFIFEVMVMGSVSC